VLKWVFKIYVKILPFVQHEMILKSLREVLTRESDYELEADSCERLEANFADDDQILFPKVYRDLSSKKILVLEFMEGCKINSVADLEKIGVNPTDVAKKLVTSYYKQLLIDGVYHADPHPGNFLVRPGPKIVFLDFGAVEEVRDNLRSGMILFLSGMITKDDDKAIDGIEEMGFVAPDGNRKLLEETVRHYFTKLVTMKIDDYSKLNVDQFISKEEVRMVRGRLRELMKAIRYPEGYFYIERSLVLLFGVCASLDPKVNALELGFPYAMQFILNQNQAQPAAPAPSPAAAIAEHDDETQLEEASKPGL
jgi:predicted unusual protein kinase regulating ubiquinone biosynthesis (AarF/ABC1/UbiB family)